MYRPTMLFTLVVLSVFLTVPLRGQELTEGMEALYTDLQTGFEGGDQEVIRTYVGPLAQIQAMQGGPGLLKDFEELHKQYDVTAVEIEPQVLQATDQWALVRSAWRLQGTDVDAGDEWEQIWHRIDLLRHTGLGWEVFSSDRISETKSANLQESVFEDAQMGLKATVPEGWVAEVIVSRHPCHCVMFAPEPGTVVHLAALELPVTLTAAEIMKSQHDVAQAIMPGLQLTVDSEGPADLGGQEAYAAVQSLTIEEQTLYIRTTVAVEGRTVYIVVALSGEPGALERLAEQIDAIKQSVEISGRQTTEVAEALGRVEGQTYVNDDLRCRITAPDNWTISVDPGTGNIGLQVTMGDPNGESGFLFGIVDLSGLPGGVDVTAQLAVQGDDTVCKQSFQGFQMYREGEIMVAGIRGYESVTEFSLAGRARGRWRVYLVDFDTLYVMVGEAVPSDRWQELEPVFKQIIDSFRLER